MDEAKHLGLINMILFIEPRFFRTAPVRMTNGRNDSTLPDVGMMPPHFGCLHLTLLREVPKIPTALERGEGVQGKSPSE